MNEVDEHLLQLIQDGDQEGWRHFVNRFQRRLLAFASKRVRPAVAAEDLVQETFVSFLSSRGTFRGDGELESFLFQILRRRIIDHYRKTGQPHELPICDFAADESGDALARVTSTDPSASWYVRQDEQNVRALDAMTAAVRNLADDLQSAEKFKELKIAEGLFFARQRNQALAAAIGIRQNEVAVIKRRLIERLRDQLMADAERVDQGFEDATLSTELLHQVWESERPSCPKRTTLGKFTLGILPANWNDYVDFHVRLLGCSFCVANLEELNSKDAVAANDGLCDRLFQSTIGFVGSQRAN